MMAKLKTGKKLEYGVFVLFIVLYSIISAFHEPWFDEAQAWQIAKCVSIKKILFSIPRYECHPPLWHLILAIPAKLGLPFELGLKSTGLFFSGLSVYLLEFKSPLPRIVRLVLPFNYFLFYQYGVIVRPYCLMILALVLVAIAFQTRNEHPWRFVLTLALLCETSAYCLAISGGIAACWLIELIQEKHTYVKTYLQDKRVFALLFLFVFALSLAVMVFPAKEVSFASIWDHSNSFLTCFFVLMTTGLSETLVMNTLFPDDQTALSSATLLPSSLLSGIIFQSIVYILIFVFASKKNLKYFLIPYCCFSLFGAAVFMSAHHLGIGFLVLLFWALINAGDENRFEIGKALSLKLNLSQKDIKKLKKLATLIAFTCLFVPVIWSVASAVSEIQLQYSYGREASHFLQETGLVDANIAMAWGEGNTSTEDPEYYEKIDIMNNGWPVSLCAYIGRNIVYNFNSGLDDVAYVRFIKLSSDEVRQTVDQWKKKGVPEVLLGQANVQLLSDNAVTIMDYEPVYKMRLNYIWKGKPFKGFQYIFVRKDLLEKYNVTPLDRPEGVVGNNFLYITDDMRNRFENGENMKSILKPQLDYVFGDEN